MQLVIILAALLLSAPTWATRPDGHGREYLYIRAMKQRATLGKDTTLLAVCAHWHAERGKTSKSATLLRRRASVEREYDFPPANDWVKGAIEDRYRVGKEKGCLEQDCGDLDKRIVADRRRLLLRELIDPAACYEEAHYGAAVSE